jgi:hypothetical protein
METPYNDVLNLLLNRYKFSTKNINPKLTTNVYELFEKTNEYNICSNLFDAIKMLNLDLNTTLKYVQRNLPQDICFPVDIKEIKQNPIYVNKDYFSNGYLNYKYGIINDNLYIPVIDNFVLPDSNQYINSKKTLITKNKITAILDIYNSYGNDKLILLNKYDLLNYIYEDIYGKAVNNKSLLDDLENYIYSLDNIKLTSDLDNYFKVGNKFLYGMKGFNCYDDYVINQARKMKIDTIIFTHSYKDNNFVSEFLNINNIPIMRKKTRIRNKRPINIVLEAEPVLELGYQMEKPDLLISQKPKMKIPEVRRSDITIPDILIPEMKRPEMRRPDITIPERPEMRRPDITIPERPDMRKPELRRPDIIIPQRPELRRPDIKIPERPEMRRPDITIPQRPDITIPQRPDITIPQRPDITIPQRPDITIPQRPDITIPQRPDITIPQRPDITIPQRPDITIPQRPDITIPQRPDIRRPDITIPQRPDIRRPDITIPQRPDITIPQRPDITIPQRHNNSSKTRYNNSSKTRY